LFACALGGTVAAHVTLIQSDETSIEDRPRLLNLSGIPYPLLFLLAAFILYHTIATTKGSSYPYPGKMGIALIAGSLATLAYFILANTILPNHVTRKTERLMVHIGLASLQLIILTVGYISFQLASGNPSEYFLKHFHVKKPFTSSSEVPLTAVRIQ
jgi:hypothetical protein